jgi:thermopsin
MSASRVIVALVVSVIMVLGAVLTVGLAPLGGTVGAGAGSGVPTNVAAASPSATPISPVPTAGASSSPASAPVSPISSTPIDCASLQTAANDPAWAAAIQHTESVASDAQAAGLPSTDLHLPYLGSIPNQVVNGVLTPGDELTAECSSYAGTSSTHPAPAGVAYDGHYSRNGTIVNYTLDSNSIDGILNVNSSRSFYPNSATPTTWGAQLNDVLANVTILGTRGYFFWTQNVVSYDTFNDTLYFVDNTWNFTARHSEMESSSLAAWSPNGGNYTGVWVAFSPYIYAPPPFTVNVYVNSSVNSAGDQVLWYNYSVEAHGRFYADGNYDYLVFKSQVPGTTPQALLPAPFEASGTQRKLVNEGYEFDAFIGADDGANNLILSANATEQLKYCSLADCTPTDFAYSSIPAAVNFGSQTGEQTVGVTSNYIGTTAYLSSGPLVMRDLWNFSGIPGAAAGNTKVVNDITVSGSPLAPLPAQPNVFVFFQNAAIATEGYAWAPDQPTWYLAPGTWNYTIMLSDYAEQNGTIVVGSSPVTLAATLPYSPQSGVYTPLWAFNDSQVAGISSSGDGTISNQYVLFNNPTNSCTACGLAANDNLSEVFYSPNDYHFESFAGIFLNGTHDYIDVNAPPSFAVYSGSLGPRAPARATFYLNIQFFETSNVTLSNAAAIRGWPAWSEISFYYTVPASQNPAPQADVYVWNSTHDLIMSNNFVAVKPLGRAVSPDQLVLYGGSDNVVWGNTFRDPPGVALGNTYAGIGEAESGDLIYNNNFSIDNPVVFLPYNYPNVADCLPQSLGGCANNANPTTNGWYYNIEANVVGNTWNVTPQPASNVAHTINGFPLSGNVLGPSVTTQGGNYYWNYGTSPNNRSTVPYVSRFYYSDWSVIYPLGCGTIQAPNSPCGTPPPVVGAYQDGMAVGGDYAPYGPTVTFTETGLPSGTSWTVSINDTPYATTHSSISIPEPYGLWNYTISTSASGYDVTPASGSVFASGAPTVRVTFTTVPQVSVTASPSSALSASALVTFTVAVTPPSGPSPNGTATLYIATASGAVQGIYAVYVTSGLGSKLLIPGLLLPHGSSTLSYWATFSGQSSPSGTLSFSTAAPTTLTLTVSPSSASAGQLVTFTVGSNGYGVAVILSAYSPSGVLLGTYSVGLSATGTGSIVLLPGLLASTTVWQVSYGTVTSNSVTVGS